MPSCTARCALCPANRRQVLPMGLSTASVMLIGDCPKFEENRSGMPFSGRGGQELDNTYLPLAGWTRNDTFSTLIVQCQQTNEAYQDVKPSSKLLQCCAANHIFSELEEVQPMIVVLFGATACELVPDIDLEYEHGIPMLREIGNWTGIVVPMYSPAAGLKETRFMVQMLDDWSKLQNRLKQINIEEEKPAVWSFTDQVGAINIFQNSFPVAVDTESNEGELYSIQVAQGDVAVMLFLDEINEYDMNRLRLLLNQSELILHNAAYDVPELNSIDVYPERYRDTMQELYHLGKYPQSLKKAVYRIFGHRMTSYEDVVLPWSKRALANWLAEAYMYVVENWKVNEQYHPIGKGCPSCGKNHRKESYTFKSHPAQAVIKRSLDKMTEPGFEQSDYDPWQKPKYAKGEVSYRLLGREWMLELEQAIGRMPRASITHAPKEEQIKYGCSDAYWTLRLAEWLEKERIRIVWQEWRIA